MGAYLTRVSTRHLPCRRDYLGGTHVLRRRALPRVGHLDRLGVGRHLGGSDPSMGRPYDTLLPDQGPAEPGSRLIYEISCRQHFSDLTLYQVIKPTPEWGPGDKAVRRAILDEQQGIARSNKYSYDNEGMNYNYHM